MVSDLVDKVERMIPFIEQVENEILREDTQLLEGIVTKMCNLVLDTAEFVSSYVQKSALSTLLPTWAEWMITIEQKDPSNLSYRQKTRRRSQI